MDIKLKRYFKTIQRERTKKFLKTALKLGAEIKIISENFKILEIKYRNKKKFLYEDSLFLNSKPGTLFTKNKEITKILLRNVALNVPVGIHAKNYKKALFFMQKSSIDYPVVVKPIDAAKGLGVTVGVRNVRELKKAIKKIKSCLKNNPLQCSGDFMVEKMEYGRDFRVLVVNNSVAACAERIPAYIIGDGKSTIKELIKLFNQQRPLNYLLEIDNDLKKNLIENNLSLDAILKKRVKITLRKNANISSGGRAVDKTSAISQRFKDIASKASRTLGLNYAGVDIMTKNISSNNPHQLYCVIEINGAPDYDIHEKPVIIGKGINATEIIFKEFLRN